MNNLYANKLLDNLDEMGKFLEKYNPSGLNYKEIENLNRSKTIKGIESVTKTSQ